MGNNLDKDKKILKAFTKVKFIMTDIQMITKNAHKEISKSINNVLKELNQLQEDIQEHEKTSFEFQEENIRLRKELETYKKIAEKLAEEFSYTDNHICNYLDATDKCKYEARKDNTNICKQCIIDWARKEVEK